MADIIIEVIDAVARLLLAIGLFILVTYKNYDRIKANTERMEIELELMTAKEENKELLRRIEKMGKPEEPERKYGTIDTFSMVYCILSVLMVMVVMALIGWLDCSWWIMLPILLAPYIIDIVVKIGLLAYVLLNKFYIKVKKRIHDKKNPPLNL